MGRAACLPSLRLCQQDRHQGASAWAITVAAPVDKNSRYAQKPALTRALAQVAPCHVPGGHRPQGDFLSATGQENRGAAEDRLVSPTADQASLWPGLGHVARHG